MGVDEEDNGALPSATASLTDNLRRYRSPPTTGRRRPPEGALARARHLVGFAEIPGDAALLRGLPCRWGGSTP